MGRAGAALAIVLLSSACGAEPSPTPPVDDPDPPAPAKPDATPTATAAPTADAASATPRPTPSPKPILEMATYAVPTGSRPHDVAPAEDGGVWYTGQGNGTLGWLDPDTGDVREIPLGAGSRPHGVIVGPDGDAWITDGGLNAIVRVDAETDAVTSYPLPGPNVNLNTAAFDGDGILWFTGQDGVYGSLDVATGEFVVRAAPRGRGPYGIAATPAGNVFFSSLAGSYLGAIDRGTGEVTVIDTPTAGGGARRVWSDSAGRPWITQWLAGSIARYDPEGDEWTEWRLPGDGPMPYAVYVDETDAVWVTDFGANALLRFDPDDEEWLAFPHESEPADVRQLLGRPGEIWGAESAADRLVVVRVSH